MPMLKMTNNIQRINQAQQTALTRISSGMRVNSAADDAASLTISEGMRAQIRGLERAQMNAQDAVSYVQTADGVIQEVTQHVQRMRELSIQSLNDTRTDADRIQLDAEFSQLKKSIASIAEYAQYNGELHSVDQHMPAYSKLEGNRIFENPVQIVSGWNDRLVIVAEPDEFTVILPEGNFKNIEDLIDQIDTQVYDTYPNIIFDVLPDRSVSLQVENYGEITKVKGPGSFLFYEYELGNPPGMIIGSTDFSTGNNKLEITAGVNDRLAFYAGAVKQYELVIPTPESSDPNGRKVSYTRDELINIVNNDLRNKGEDQITAQKFGDKYISITSDKYVITGLSGNMIKIDGISSFLYDISNTGIISKTNGSYYGSARLQNDVIEFAKGTNDELTFTLDNQSPVTISLLNDGEQVANLSGAEIVSRLNERLAAQGLKMKASFDSGRLKLESEFYGNTSRVSVNHASNAYETLFTRQETHYFSPTIQQGRLEKATLSGNYKERSTTEITAANNELVISVNGVDVPLTIDEGEYTADQLMDELNAKLPPELSLTFAYTTSGGKQAFTLTSDQAETTVAFTGQSLASSAFETIFGGEQIIFPSYTSGSTSAPIPPLEGTVGESQITTTPAKVTGSVDIQNGLTIQAENNILRFTLNGQEETITLVPGFFTKDVLIQTLNAQLSGIAVTAEAVVSGGKTYLSLVSEDKGNHMRFQHASGFGMERLDQVSTSAQSRTVTEIEPSVTGYSILKNEPTYINSSNNSMSFIYSDENGDHAVTITVPEAVYSNRAKFVEAMNDQLKSPELMDLNFKFTIDSNRIQLIGNEKGKEYGFKNLTGNLYDEFFRKAEFVYDGYGYSGRTAPQEDTYILGRQPIGNTVEIFPNINEVLSFDIYKNSIPTKVDVIVPPNTYTRNGFISAFNTALKEGLKAAGFEEDLMKAQIGMEASKPPVNYDKSDKFVLLFNEHNDGRNDSGTYQIQGVRGTAAYTYFYNSQGDPKPSYIVGITDMSQGAVIETGLNDEFTLDIDDVTKNFTIPAGDYSQEELLDELNRLLTSEQTGLIASYDNNKLKFSNREYGAIPIDGFAGSARDFLFFRTERREQQEELKFQVGANSGQSLDYNRVRLSDQLLRVNTLTISHRAGAEKALERLSIAISSLTGKSGYVGAIENRLDHIIRVNEINVENLVSAESRIRDADIAKEMFNQMKSSLLLQANQAMMSHAKIFPEGILQLLRT
nr:MULTISPECIES: flagellin [unclassified Sporosarcina]